MSEGDERAARRAAADAEQARAEAVDVKQDVEETLEDVVETRDDAEAARAGANQAQANARIAEQGALEAQEKSQQSEHRAAASARHAATAAAAEPSDNPDPVADELLIHPDDAPDHDGPAPFGEPGPPVSRRAPFYIGFIGALGALTALALVRGIENVRPILVLVLVAAFLAVGLNPLVEWLIHRGFRRRWSVLIVTLGVVVVVTAFIGALVPVLQDQIDALIASAPGWLDDLERNTIIQGLDAKYDVIQTARDKLQDPNLANTAFGSLFTVGLAVLSAFLNAFIIFVLTIYFLSALPGMKRACYSLAPASRRTRVTYLGDEILRRVGGYVAGAFVVALCAGVSSFIFLEFAGLGRYAVALALVVALLDFIPLIGATIGAAIVTLIGFATDPKIGLACLIFYLVYQQVENYLIYPRVMRSSVDVPGVVTVIAVLIGGALLGVVGALLAIPTAAALLLLVREVWLPKQAES
ncbi:MAG: AI-2E family transporter [Nocardioidaceae bacterium]